MATSTPSPHSSSGSASPTAREFPAVKTLPPLSPFTYYRRNLMRTLPVGGSIAISVFLVAAIVTLLSSVDESITTNYGLVRRLSILGTQLVRDVPPRVVEKTRHTPSLKQKIATVTYLRNIRTVFGEMPVPIFGLDAKDIPTVVEVSGNRLARGAWPRPGEPEVVLSRAWANNLGKRLGDWIEPPKNDRLPTLLEKLRLVGILEGGENIGIIDKSFLLLTLPEPAVRTSYLLIPETPRRLKAMNTSIETLLKGSKERGLTKNDLRFVKFYTFDGLVRELRESLGFLYKFLGIADALVIGAVALLSGFLANIYFEQRLGEFGLLSAFGFRRERLARRLMIETGFLVVLGWLCGLALTWGVFRLLDAYYMSPRGLVLAQLNSFIVLFTLPTPILVGIASLATVLFRLYRFDPIEIMERR
ncbi:MAG TPA: ABC transporter permease [Abditibacteriaceae bacterium]|nr:ABC transporter permease [Abditibacteriaceae bacterium]